MGRDYDRYYEAQFQEERKVNILGLLSFEHAYSEREAQRLGDSGTASDADKCPDSGDNVTDRAESVRRPVVAD